VAGRANIVRDDGAGYGNDERHGKTPRVLTLRQFRHRNVNQPDFEEAMRSLATAISGKTGKLDRLDAAPHMSIDADSRGNGEIIEPLVRASLDELERLLREHSLESAACTPSEGLYCPKRGSMDNQDYLEFVTVLEDTRTRIETIFSELPISGATKARLKRVAADLERAVQIYRDKSNASRS